MSYSLFLCIQLYESIKYTLLGKLMANESEVTNHS